MWLLSVNRSHDASICLSKDGEVVLHCLEERLTHLKNSQEVVYCLDMISSYTDTIDYLVVTNINEAYRDAHPFYIDSILKKNGVKVLHSVMSSSMHHSFHAISGLMSSPFEKAICIIVDGAGSDLSHTSKENETIVEVEIKDGVFAYQNLHKTVIGDDPRYPSVYGAGMSYNAITKHIGFKDLEDGKTMGLAPYGVIDKKYVPLIDRNGANPLCFKPFMHEHYGITALLYKDDLHADDLSFEEKATFAYKIQTDFEKYIYNLCKKAMQLSDCKNIVLSGGCFLNCVSNFKLIKRLPEDINLYVDPLCSDGGISIGQSYVCNTELVGLSKENNLSVKKYNPTYMGSSLVYDYQLKNDQHQENTDPEKVAKLLAEGNIIAIAQGRSETGPRSLGNRSILFDPRVKNGKELVNKVKKRESWRPFAGTVMLEYAKEWFDMNRLEESPLMTYAIDTLPEKQNCISSIVHVDGTCRIQTVTKEQNKHYYNLISEFNNLTGTPIVLNTSFNLAGDTIVDTMEDALRTLEQSDIEYLYLPDIMKLIYVPNK